MSITYTPHYVRQNKCIHTIPLEARLGVGILRFEALHFLPKQYENEV